MSLNRSIFSSFLTQFPVIISGIVSGVIITRLIGVEGKGIHSIFIANIQLLTLFFSLSANTGITYYLSTKEISPSKVIGFTLAIFFLLVALGGVVVFFPLWIDKLLFPSNYDSIIFKFYLFFSFVLTLASTFFSGIFQGFQKYKIINRIAIFNSLFNLILFFLLYLHPFFHVFDNELSNVFLFSLIVLTTDVLIWLIIYIYVIKIPPNFNISLKEEIYPFMKYLGTGHLSNVLNFFNYRLDIWFISFYNGMEQLGLYSLAVSVSQLLLMGSNPLVYVLFPYLSSEKNKDKKLDRLAFFSRVNIFILFIAFIFMFIFGGFLIPFVYGADFDKCLEAFYIMLFSSFFLGVTKVFATYLASENKVHYNLIATILGFIITLSLNFLLIPIYGIKGAAFTSLFAYLTILIFVSHKTLIDCNNQYLNFFFINLSDIDLLKNKLNNKNGK